MPKILITGGAGYIGSHVAFYMAQNGYEVIIIDNFSHNQEFHPNWAKVIKSDYANKEILNQIFIQNEIEAVMHLAGSIEVNESIIDPLKYYNNNVEKSIQLFDSMIKNGVKKLIFSSSCAVYGVPQYLPLNEQHPTNPLSPYGRSKLIIEDILKDLNEAYGLDYINIRYFNAAGALPEF
jgi:UDP-glucose 4-epimerase